MANKQRIEQLEKYLSEDKNDPFLKYALATEHIESEPQKSLSFFEDLLKNHEDYIGTYYHAAALYTMLGEQAKAEQTYLAGISKAQQLNELHALKELKSAYMNFQMEMD